MRCHYLSDLHLENQDFPWTLPHGDVLIIAGDLCHARCLDPAATDRPDVAQRDRVNRFIDAARENFRHVLMVAGNHDHYEGVFEDTAATLARWLPGVTVLDDSAVEIDGTTFFGSTLWSDFEGRSAAAMNAVRKRCGEYFFVKTRSVDADGGTRLAKFQPENALAAFDKAWAALNARLAGHTTKRTVVVTHFAPSLRGLNPFHAGNGLDGAYASDLDTFIENMRQVAVWVHGHTHIRRVYRVGAVSMRTNCRGFDDRDVSARGFSPDTFFDVEVPG